MSAVKKGDRIEPALKVAYATKSYSADATCDTSDKILVNTSLSEVAPGLKLGASVTLPDPTSGKLNAEYSMPYLNLKTSVSLTSAPTVDLSATTGYQSFVLGGEAGYSTAKADLTKWNFGIAYNAPDYQAAALLTDKASAVKLMYAHNVTPKVSVGAEIAKKLAGGDTVFAVGYSRRLSTGALAKVKVENSGLVSALYETKLATGEKVTGSLQLLATDTTKPVKYGFALDLF